MANPVRGSSSPGSPGVSGAIKDAIGAIAKTFGPASITQQKARNDADESAAEGGPSDEVIGRMRAAQSSDKDNSYSY